MTSVAITTRNQSLASQRRGSPAGRGIITIGSAVAVVLLALLAAMLATFGGSESLAPFVPGGPDVFGNVV
jgi:hypothetical protein